MKQELGIDKAVNLRDSIIRSLAAVGAVDETRFYAEYFKALEPERFALFVIDKRCLKNPLLETMIGNIRILSDLGLYPTLLIGALDTDMTNVRFQVQRLDKELNHANVRTVRINTASYDILPDITRAARQGIVPILEQTTPQTPEGFQELVESIRPYKVIFLQPSGGLTRGGKRVAVINANSATPPQLDPLTPGQDNFMKLAMKLSSEESFPCVYVIASPLNLMGELFTTQGTGTMIRRGAEIKVYKTFRKVDKPRLWASISDGFGKVLNPDFTRRKIERLFLDTEYRGGAIITKVNDLNYLSKFWVKRGVRGEGLARDIWDKLTEEVDSFFWRSRRDNPFNDWYLNQCDGMQVQGNWRIFWRGLSAAQITKAITAASQMPIDFADEDPPRTE